MIAGIIPTQNTAKHEQVTSVVNAEGLKQNKNH
jgi:hypothetical protein